ncbi:uncharacterized protein METZ01_LOCUS387072 [marine metagenome]|uniref:Monofunctional biosynthetic peptidoglycan transglycosylase n=1 Tax=marine metagenome TaxID=408172 RepID=A0A382UKJ3_9ZZZZ
MIRGLMSGARRVWRIWSRGVRIFGTGLMFVVLTIIYWTMVPVLWLPLRIFSDPLSLKAKSGGWRQSEQRPAGLDWMKRQG